MGTNAPIFNLFSYDSFDNIIIQFVFRHDACLLGLVYISVVLNLFFVGSHIFCGYPYY